MALASLLGKIIAAGRGRELQLALQFPMVQNRTNVTTLVAGLTWVDHREGTKARACPAAVMLHISHQPDARRAIQAPAQIHSNRAVAAQATTNGGFQHHAEMVGIFAIAAIAQTAAGIEFEITL